MCTAIQTYRILTLQSLIYAYTMSTLHLENLKTSDAQNTCMGVFGAYFFYQLSNSKVSSCFISAREEDLANQARNHHLQHSVLDVCDRTSSNLVDLHASVSALLKGVLSPGRPEGDQRQ